MEKEALQADRNIQILDIHDHLHTLVSLGHTSAGKPYANPGSIRIRDIKSLARRASTVSSKKQVSIWRSWRGKMHWGELLGKSRNFSIDYPARFKDSNGFSPGNFHTPYANTTRNRLSKNSPVKSNLTGYYNGASNGSTMVQPTPPSYNEFFQTKQRDGCVSKSEICFTLKEYCDHCTIHGLKYIGDMSLSTFERCFWIVSFLLATAGAAFFIWHLLDKYERSPIIISRNSETVSLEQFPFPAITVCNMNNARRSIAQKIANGNNTLERSHLVDVCDFGNDTNYTTNEKSHGGKGKESLDEFMVNVSQSCEQMLYYCLWHGNATNCSEIFNPVLTDEGLCCKFNSVPRNLLFFDPRIWENLHVSYASENHIDWTPEYKFSKDDPANAIPWRAYGSGSSYGLTIAMDVEVDDYYCSSTASVGFKMLLHSPVEMPQIRDFAFTLAPGKETRVIITPKITDADMSIAVIPPKIRQCYFLQERKLRYYRTYTQRNCVLECEANFTLKYCECMQFYMPLTEETRVCGKHDDECSKNARKFMKTKLYEEDDYVSNTFNVSEAPSCKCYPGCHEINYRTEISESMLISTFFIPEEIFRYSNQYFEKNVALVHVFFVESSYIKYTKNELYGFAELLSNTGGLLGLFMGFSLISVIELIYYATIRLWARISKHKTKTVKKKLIFPPSKRRREAVIPFVQ